MHQNQVAALRCLFALEDALEVSGHARLRRVVFEPQQDVGPAALGVVFLRLQSDELYLGVARMHRRGEEVLKCEGIRGTLADDPNAHC